MQVRMIKQTAYEYVHSIPGDFEDTLECLRLLSKTFLGGYQEKIEKGFVTYSKNDLIDVAFGYSDNGVKMFFFNEHVLSRVRRKLAGMFCENGCFNFKKLEEINQEGIIELLIKTKRSVYLDSRLLFRTNVDLADIMFSTQN